MPNMKRNDDWSYGMSFLSILLAAFLWGTSGTVASFSQGLSPIAIGTISLGFGGLIHAFISISLIKKNIYLLKQHKKILFIGVIATTIYPLAFYSSLSLAGIAIGTVISIGSAPLFAALLEFFCDRKKLSIKWLVSFFLGITGIVFLSLGDSAQNQIVDLFNRIIGICLGVIAGITYAIYSWIAKKLIGKGIDARATMGIVFGVSAFILLPTLFFTGSNLLNYSVNWGVAIYLAVIPMFLGYFLFSVGLKKIATSKAITLSLFEPFVATLLAIFVVGEHLSLIGYLGLSLIFVCIFLLVKVE
ncbi:EamA family transporter [Acinetobacter baumannii]